MQFSVIFPEKLQYSDTQAKILPVLTNHKVPKTCSHTHSHLLIHWKARPETDGTYKIFTCVWTSSSG